LTGSGEKREVGIIGCGEIGLGVHLPLLEAIGSVHVKYLADIKKPATRGAIRGIPFIRVDGDVAALPSCDIVVLAIPVGARDAYVREFAKRGTAIFSEKPFALNLDQHKVFLDLCKRITCNYATIYSRAVRQMRLVVDSGIFGDVKSVRLSEGGIIGRTGKPKNHYQMNVDLCGGGILIEKGCHDLASLTFILHSHTIEAKSAKITCHDRLDVDVEAHLRASDIDIEYRISLVKPLAGGCEFIFQNATLQFDQTNLGSEIRVKGAGNHHVLTFEPISAWASSKKEAFYLKWKYFLEALDSQYELDTAFETCLPVTRLIDDIYCLGRQ